MAGLAHNNIRDNPDRTGWLATLWAVPRGWWTGIAAVYCVLFLAVQSALGQTDAGVLFDLLGFLPASIGATLAFWSAARAPVPAGNPPAQGSETILVVEDEPSVIGMTRGLLERHGYRVLVATSARAGRRILEARDTRIDLLLSDVVMPGESGVDLASWARSQNPALPVLFMTGYADEETWRDGEELTRSVAILPKPFKPEQLVAQVRAALDGPHSAA